MQYHTSRCCEQHGSSIDCGFEQRIDQTMHLQRGAAAGEGRATRLDSVEKIVDGKVDERSEDDFYMIGKVE